MMCTETDRTGKKCTLFVEVMRTFLFWAKAFKIFKKMLEGAKNLFLKTYIVYVKEHLEFHYADFKFTEIVF
jgi:hypothetical protein